MEPLKKYFKSEFKVEMFLLDHPAASDFTLSCWQRNRQALPLLLWRGFIFLSSLTIALASMITFMISSIFGYWFIYLTHWGVLFIVLMSGFATGISVRCYLRGPIDAGLGLPWYIKTYWVLYNIAVPLALLITIFYWALLYDTGVEEELNMGLDIAVHGLNAVLVFMKLMSVRHRSRILHFYHPLIVALVYMIFGLIHYAAGGADQNGNHWIYPVINWADPGPTSLLVFMTALMLLGLHLLTVSLAAIRDATVNKFIKRDNDTPMPEVMPFRDNISRQEPRVLIITGN